MIASRDECCGVLLCRGDQEDCDERTKLQIRSEDRDACTKVVKRAVMTNGQNSRIGPERWDMRTSFEPQSVLYQFPVS